MAHLSRYAWNAALTATDACASAVVGVRRADAIEPVQSWIRSRSRLARALERADDPLAELPMTVDLNLLTGHIVLVGYGEVGRRIGEALTARGVPIVVADQNREIVEQLRQRDIPAVCGDVGGIYLSEHVLALTMARHVLDRLADNSRRRPGADDGGGS